MYDDILLPTDGTDSMEPVYAHTIDLARKHDATVHVLYVVDDRAFITLASDLVDDVVGELEGKGKEATTAALDRLEAEGVEATSVLRRGNPAEEIIDYIETAGVDVVTMGTHGSNYQENMVGSVSARVVADAPVPVLTVNVNGDD
ncbi:universal stress protein [Halogeometricum sp. CBA1124]|jgi:nucleotide-binding universal stress UspA family protein|uniref:universal stress protein n=1 Tax=Halogeometricum sp. CBA1124 TaxID=2668071 RepID=UPI00142CA04E|nr:universal stress protein [Halogeometricum sp. CBA1124]MUV56958.1 universal stress protein [Halogeometricum sp. CBA1124]